MNLQVYCQYCKQEITISELIKLEACATCLISFKDYIDNFKQSAKQSINHVGIYEHLDPIGFGLCVEYLHEYICNRSTSHDLIIRFLNDILGYHPPDSQIQEYLDSLINSGLIGESTEQINSRTVKYYSSITSP